MTYRTFLASSGLVLAAVLAACGGGDDAAALPDAFNQADSGPNPDGGISCDFHETAENDNDQTAEVTGLSSGATGIRICGAIAAREPSPLDVIDADRYLFSVRAGGDYLIRIRSSGAEQLTLLASHVGSVTQTVSIGRFVGDHMVYAAELSPGQFTVHVVAYGAEAPVDPIDYELTIEADVPETRCAQVSGDPSYVEAEDGGGNVGNDVLNFSTDPNPSAFMTPANTDAPEPTGVVVSSGMSYKITGTAETNTAAAADPYQDRDTYLIATGGRTNELSLRAAWPGSDANLDFLILPVNGTNPMSGATHGGNLGPEFNTTAILPSSTYWLWVGNRDGSAEPKVYELTICGAEFVP